MSIVNDMDLIVNKFSVQNKIENIQNMDKLCNIRLENKANKNISMINNQTDNNFTKSNNETTMNNLTYKLIKLSDLNEEDHEEIFQYIQSTNKTYKEKLCKTCFDQTKLLEFLKKELKIITQDIQVFVNKTNSKQDVVAKVADRLNRVNFIKFNTFFIKSLLKLTGKLGCNEFKENNRNLNLIMKNSNVLVEGIQNSIRKGNLNVNFLILS